MRIIGIRNLGAITFLALVSIFNFSVRIAEAKTQYVSDELVIMMREGKGNEYKITKMLKAGTPLEVIEEDQLYLRARTQDGKEGWVLKQYITSETPKANVIAGLIQEIDRLKTQTRGVVDLVTERDKLKALSGKLSTETEHLREDNSRLKRLQMLWWFLAGAGVFFTGWLTGRVSRKKKYY